MLFTYTGNNPLFLEQSFFDQNGTLSVIVSAQSDTEIVLSHTAFVVA